MRKDDYYINALKAGNYKRMQWIICILSVVQEEESAWKKDPYPYRLVQTPTGFSYVNPNQPDQLEIIEDAQAGVPLISPKQTLIIKPGDIPNYLGDTELQTSYGNLLFNWITLVYAFGNKVPYQDSDKPLSISKIKNLIIPKLQDDVDDISQEKQEHIYIREFLKFAEGVYFLTNFTRLTIQAATEKMLLPPPGIKEFRDKLLSENAATLNDTATVAKIDAELIKYDAEYLKGDPSENYLISAKSRQTVRKKLFLMHGAELGLDDNTTKAALIQNSLSEGWDVTKFPELNNASRAGSYFRGAETMLGGVSAKELLRASSNINIVEGDCKAQIGIATAITEDLLENLSNFSFVDDAGQTTKFKDKEHVGQYLGQTLMIRSPAYCLLPSTDFCSVCCGDKLSVNKEGASIEIMGYGSAFLTMSLKRMHSNVLALAKMDITKSIT